MEKTYNLKFKGQDIILPEPDALEILNQLLNQLMDVEDKNELKKIFLNLD